MHIWASLIHWWDCCRCTGFDSSWGIDWHDKHVEIQGKIPPTGFVSRKQRPQLPDIIDVKSGFETTGFSTPFFHINALTLKIKAKLTDDEWQVDWKAQILSVSY